jgi:hypothetical protein
MIVSIWHPYISRNAAEQILRNHWNLNKTNDLIILRASLTIAQVCLDYFKILPQSGQSVNRNI